MCDEFGEVLGIIDLVINFLASGALFLNSYDTLSYMPKIRYCFSQWGFGGCFFLCLFCSLVPFQDLWFRYSFEVQCIMYSNHSVVYGR